MKRKILIGVTIIGLLVGGFIIGNILEPIKSWSATGAIQKPLNTSVDNVTWTAVTLGSGQRCESFVAKTRGSQAWKMSDTSTGTKYITIGGTNSLSMDISADRGETLFYVQTASASDTIEVLITRAN